MDNYNDEEFAQAIAELKSEMLWVISVSFAAFCLITIIITNFKEQLGFIY